MFMAVDSGRCPACCAPGRRLRAPADIFVCPACRAVFGEFGIIINPDNSSGEQHMA